MTIQIASSMILIPRKGAKRFQLWGWLSAEPATCLCAVKDRLSNVKCSTDSPLHLGTCHAGMGQISLAYQFML